MVELGFNTLYSRMCAMMAHMVLHENFNTGLWPECASTTDKLENIMVNPHEEIFAHKKLYGKIIDYPKYLRTFGEMGFLCIIATVK